MRREKQLREPKENYHRNVSPMLFGIESEKKNKQDRRASERASELSEHTLCVQTHRFCSLLLCSFFSPFFITMTKRSQQGSEFTMQVQCQMQKRKEKNCSVLFINICELVFIFLFFFFSFACSLHCAAQSNLRF